MYTILEVPGFVDTTISPAPWTPAEDDGWRPAPEPFEPEPEDEAARVVLFPDDDDDDVMLDERALASAWQDMTDGTHGYTARLAG